MDVKEDLSYPVDERVTVEEMFKKPIHPHKDSFDTQRVTRATSNVSAVHVDAGRPPRHFRYVTSDFTNSSSIVSSMTRVAETQQTPDTEDATKLHVLAVHVKEHVKVEEHKEKNGFFGVLVTVRLVIKWTGDLVSVGRWRTPSLEAICVPT